MGFISYITGLFSPNRNIVENEPKNEKQAYIPLTQVSEHITRIDTQNWVHAQNVALSVERPRRDALMRVFRVVGIEAKAKTQKRILSTLATPFFIANENGEQDTDKTKQLKKAWFYKFLKYVLEANFYGYSLIQIVFDKDNLAVDCKLVPRENVIPEYMGVLEDVNGERFTRFDLPPYTSSYIFVKADDLGIFNDIAQSAISLKNARAAWDAYRYLFGVPLRMATTDSRDNKVLNTLEQNLKNMGSAAYILVPSGTQLEVLQNSNSGDPYKVFLEAMNEAKSTINETILGSPQNNQTGSYAKEKVFKEVAQDITNADLALCSSTVNDLLLPLLNGWGYDFSGGLFSFDLSWSLDLANNQLEIDKWLQENFVLPLDYIRKTYGVDVEERKDPMPQKPQAPQTPQAPPAQPKSEHHSEANPDFEGKTGEPVALFEEWAVVEGLLNDLLTGKLKPSDLNEKLFNTLVGKFREGMQEGTGENWNKTNFASDNYELYQAMQRSVFTFSAARTYQELREIQGLLYENGVLVSRQVFKERLKDFVERANQIDAKFNGAWLDTEYNAAVNQSRLNQRWQGFMNNSDIYPNLKFVAVKDERTRDSHRALDGVIKPIDSAFWDKYAPLLGWNCRCYLVATDEPENEPTDGLPEVPKEFDGNPAKQGVVFLNSHPYFDIPAEDAPLVEASGEALAKQYHIRENRAIFDALDRSKFVIKEQDFNKKTGGFVVAKAGFEIAKDPRNAGTLEILAKMGFGVIYQNENEVSVNGSKTEVRTSTDNTTEEYKKLLLKQNENSDSILLRIQYLNRPALLAAINDLRDTPNSPFKTSKVALVILMEGKLTIISNAELRRQEATNKKINAL